ncbi:lipase 3 isoform X2 [Monomorium pharaonis]|uniref:lipase 3 isoform X2 n=1 Tax=Monomorium pharaonis TaxID=307658 RepID=UPI00063F98FF|nr:lipase 3 isoform X2 [Monomorium pharaonis]XP_036139603.1 lipase 3 isoform X2 [Monomorium pharaonis]
MRLIVLVYLLFLCNFLDSVGAGILNFPEECLKNVFTRMLRISREQSNFSKYASSKVYLRKESIIQKEGYPEEIHVIPTEDGYLLTLYRITGKNGSLPVLLLHGLLSSYTDWVISGKNKALAFILADQGYDVWMGNFRGNTYSRAHISLSPSSSKFWNFSFHEMGIYDLPAMISFITNITLQPLHAYIGHSMGTTVSYVMAAERPEIAQKVRLIISLAPQAFLKHMKSPIRYLAPFAEDAQELLHILGQDEFFPESCVTRFLTKLTCNNVNLQEHFCTNVIFLLFGFDSEQFNTSLLPTIANNNPAGSSTKTIIHFAQGYKSSKFRQYDYGRVKNLYIYNAIEPPDYNLANITVPIALFYAENDWLSSIPDVKKLSSLLPNVVEEYKVPFSRFNHLDYLWAKDAPQLVYTKLLEVIMPMH